MTSNEICCRCFFLYLCVLCDASCGIEPHFFLFWSNRVSKELGLKSLKHLATECLVQSRQLKTTKMMHFKVLFNTARGFIVR